MTPGNACRLEEESFKRKKEKQRVQGIKAMRKETNEGELRGEELRGWEVTKGQGKCDTRQQNATPLLLTVNLKMQILTQSSWFSLILIFMQMGQTKSNSGQ